MNNPYEESYNKLDKELDGLVKEHPFGFWDKEFEDLLILKIQFKTWEKAREQVLDEIDKRFEGHKCMERWEWNEFKDKELRNKKEKSE
jgi:hypothetical protein